MFRKAEKRKGRITWCNNGSDCNRMIKGHMPVFSSLEIMQESH